MRPVGEVTANREKIRQANLPARQRSVVNETLRWRTSSDLRPQAHHLPSDDVFADDVKQSNVPNPMRDVRTAQYHRQAYRETAPAANQTRTAANQSQPSAVQQAAWSPEARAILNEALTHQPVDRPAKQIEAQLVDAKQDFFGNPFGKSQHATASARIDRSEANEQSGSRRASTNQQFNDFQNDSPQHTQLPGGVNAVRQSEPKFQRLANQFELPTPGGEASAADGPTNALRGGAAPSDAFDLPLPGANADRGLPAPADSFPTSPAPAVKAPASGFDSLFEDVPADAAAKSSDPSDLFEDVEVQDMQAAKGEKAPAADTASPQLRELLQSETPGRSAPPKVESLDTLPEPNKIGNDAMDSPSDRDDMFENPFPKRERSGSDQDDRDRLQLRMKQMQDEDRAADKDARAKSEEEDEAADGQANVAEGLSCDEFRRRISREDIRTLSLDISAPFRPDVFKIKEYEKLKRKFDEAQTVRQWTSMDGNVLGFGRLRDLAYEKAIIENEQGTRQEIQVDQLSEGDLAYISQNWGLPKECRLEQVAYTPRNWQPHVMTWKASNLCHKPLYFEEVNLERYGHTAGPILQPVVSSAHFFANIAVMPYKMGIHPPSECQYALGYYRPGNCAPWIVPPVPLSLRGAAAQVAAVTTGFVFIP
ncbi:hypothetical protein K239x_36610 [Planctomycetes bacterium K23_9]|uniref:Uncharacterized protein n=2 Tax=Stieleria marina TaxID=1930275 RepID=A0A517NX17_9BACT|nr:hypothetical protein K239x_36610 [Planctomycetes bacterium K23_9]